MSCFFFQAEDGIRDLTVTGVQTCALPIWAARAHRPARGSRTRTEGEEMKGVTKSAGKTPEDRKSTRLNSSHSQISYAVFCLKKKKTRKVRAAREMGVPCDRRERAGRHVEG